MSEPLVIYSCPVCPQVFGGWPGWTCSDGHPELAAVPVRVFREDVVRPLWNALLICEGEVAEPDVVYDATGALAACPAPADWRAA